MSENFIQTVYFTMLGELDTKHCIPEVTNEFSTNMPCAQLYETVYAANRRICQKLGNVEEDRDIETIINSLLQIQQLLCFQMYKYGARFGVL